MWLSSDAPLPNWIQFEFDNVYMLDEMWVWNFNDFIERIVGFGAKDVTVEYSTDGSTWAELAGVAPFAQAAGANDYPADTLIDFGGVMAKYVKLTVNSTWGGGAECGLSEVRFFQIPVWAREPQPADAATGVSADAILNWRPGRQAASHVVYLSEDVNAVASGTASAATVADHRFVANLDYDTTYYWRVDEVNDAAASAAWEGAVWSFTTEEYGIIDDFESYNDIDPPDPGSHRIFEAWKDGFGIATNGALVGNELPPYAERTIVRGGRQSMSLFYNNTGGATFSEAVRTFAAAQDWTQHGIATLVLYFHGTAGNTGQLYVKVNGAKVLCGGNAADITRPIWKQWNIDLASLGIALQNVTTLAVGIDGSGASGTLYLDDIVLYRLAPTVASEEIWIEAEAGSITPPLLVFPAASGASGGQYIEVESGNNSTGNPPTAGGVAGYAITVRGGTYKVNCRVIAPSTGDDSLWVRIQGATTQTTNHSSGWVRWNDMAPGSDWQWDFVHSSDDANQEVEWTMAAGTYTLEIAYREDGALLDAIVIQSVD